MRRATLSHIVQDLCHRQSQHRVRSMAEHQLTLSRSKRLREDAIGQQVLHVPFGRTLSLPGPENPTSRLLVCIKLSFNESTNVALVRRRQSSNRARRLASAVADLGGTVQSTVVTRTLILTVQPLGAIRNTTRPFAGDGPLVVRRHLITEVAGSLDMVINTHSHSTIVENLVVMGVEKEVPHARTPIIPTCHTLEGVVESYCHVGIPQVSPPIHVELPDSVHVEVGAKRFVEKFNG